MESVNCPLSRCSNSNPVASSPYPLEVDESFVPCSLDLAEIEGFTWERRFRDEKEFDACILSVPFGSESFGPESMLPESVFTESMVPESIVPDSVLTESMVPESMVPEPVLTESMVPESMAPEFCEPESASIPSFGRTWLGLYAPAVHKLQGYPPPYPLRSTPKLLSGAVLLTEEESPEMQLLVRQTMMDCFPLAVDFLP